MIEEYQDEWARWLLQRRHGGDPEALKSALEFLYPIRDKILENSRLTEGEVLKDIGCGDGLVARGWRAFR